MARQEEKRGVVGGSNIPKLGWLLTTILACLILVLVVEPLIKAHSSLPTSPVMSAVAKLLPRLAPSSPDGIVGVYVVYRRPKAFLAAALSFRTAYPDSPLYIVCDSGCYDYRKVAAGLGARFLGPLRLTIKNGRMFMSTDECMALFDVWRR